MMKRSNGSDRPLEKLARRLQRAEAASDIAAPDLGLSTALSLRERVIESSANAMVISRAQGSGFVIEHVNPAFERITGYSAAEIVGKNCRFLQGGDHDQPALDEIRAALREQRPGNAILRNYRKDGSLFWNHLFVAPVFDQAGTATHFVASQYDITHSKVLESQLLYQATHDELTGLPNRSLLQDRLQHALAQAARSGERIWLAFLGLEGLKGISDNLGHAAADEVLKIVSARMAGVLRASDTIARWSGDEFTILMPGQGADTGPVAALERLLGAVSSPVSLGGQEYVVRSSMGVASYPEDGAEPALLLKCADIAARHAKADGRHHFRFHTPDMNARALARLRTEADLRQAIRRDEFVLHYQPQIDLSSGQVVGAEALVRWMAPGRGLVGPVEFIAIAEECGLIEEIGNWVLRTACRQSVAWRRSGLPPVRMAVNLSARQFVHKDLAGMIGAVLADSGLAGPDLELELTEGVVMRDVEHGISVLRELKALGVQIAIDDFGTGYSSLSYLKRFPIDVLKIDRSFVIDIGQGNGDDEAIVASIIALSHSLKLRVIAEGVETAAQLAYLGSQHCDEVQGYYFSRPLPAQAFEAFLRERTPARQGAG
ncbi:EAL domain-containing protein [Massilia sp. PAMC28688]|uniref:putative bifunctional diguanylate cyclase/phosphodiesterase n=1 Tax=Massilia sp. PAMC28688 TaxID=2861283 RepID=UPI001C62B5C0|nr:EAL domain-containing protein [Massilia sp. PAMC28688]QYF91815.1 EAL domain-containing protein [Massilia sp. PAMC28688]